MPITVPMERKMSKNIVLKTKPKPYVKPSIPANKAEKLLQSFALELAQQRYDKQHLISVYSDIISSASKREPIELRLNK